MSDPTAPPLDSPFQAAWATWAAPGCGRIGPLADEPWMWNLAVQLPLGWCIQPAPTRRTPPYTYCPDHAFRYRGCTPPGRRCSPARRPGYRRRASRWVLRSYSTDRRPCRCGAAARELVACWGARWRCPQPFGHLQPGACPTCAGTLHVDDDAAAGCLTCGYTRSSNDDEYIADFIRNNAADD